MWSLPEVQKHCDENGTACPIPIHTIALDRFLDHFLPRSTLPYGVYMHYIYATFLTIQYESTVSTETILITRIDLHRYTQQT